MGTTARSLVRVPLGADVPGRDHVTRIVPYALRDGLALPTRWRGPAMLRGLVAADGLLFLAPGEGHAEAIRARRLPWD